MTEIGRAIRKKRKQLKLNQKQVAAKAGCSERSVHVLEAGKPTMTETLLCVLGALGLSFDVNGGEPT